MFYKITCLISIFILLHCSSSNSTDSSKSKKLANFMLALDYKKSECKSMKKCNKDCVPKSPSIELIYFIIGNENIQLSTVNNCSFAIMKSSCPFNEYPTLACAEVLHPLKSKKKAEQFYLFDNKEKLRKEL